MNDTTPTSTAVAPRGPAAVFQHDMSNMASQFAAALPPHIPVDRFMRVVQTAVMSSWQQSLLKADRRSLWNACMKAAQDGLLPDGREAALIDKGGTVVYMPMVAGIRKKARNSGEIATWDTQIVCENDHFQFQLGDNPQVNHSYDLKQERGKMIGAYSICLLKDGSKSYEVMSIGEINKIRDRTDGWKAHVSKGKSTPWATDPEEMGRKTVAKRHAKVLPMSTDLDDLVRRDDELYNFAEAREDAKASADKPKGIGAKLSALAGDADRARAALAAGANVETGEIIEHEDQADGGAPADQSGGGEGGGSAAAPPSKPPPAAKRKRAMPQPQPEPPPAAPSLAAPPAGTDEDLGPVDDDDTGSVVEAVEEAQPAGLSGADKGVLVGYHNELMHAMSVTKLQASSKSYFDEVPPEGTPLGDAVFAVYQAHYARIMEGAPATDSDKVLARYTKAA